MSDQIDNKNDAQKVVALRPVAKNGPLAANENDVKLEATHNFTFVFLDGTSYTYVGALACTPSFVGIGAADGTIVGVVPLDNLKCVYETPAHLVPLPSVAI